MNVSTLRSIDRWAGVPACVALTFHRRLVGRQGIGKPIRRILFVKLAEQGSTVLALDAIGRAQERVGRENVFFLAFEENRFILDAVRIVPAENVLAMDVQTPGRAARSLARVLGRLRALEIDAAINLEFFARSSAILCYLSGADHRVGLHSYAGEGPYCGDLMTHRLVHNPYLHTADLFGVMVEALDHPFGRFPAFDLQTPSGRDAGVSYAPPPADLAQMRALVAEATGPRHARPLILLNANCSDLLPLRRWSPSYYVELARRLLSALPDARVACTGAPREARAVDRIADSVSSARCISLAGRTTLSELLALYTIADVLVTNDSGPAQFATLTPIDVVTLFGPETPALFAARTPRNHVMWAGIACSPCVSAFNNRQTKCRDNVCMQRISVDHVFETTMKAWEARRAAARTTPGS